MEKTLKQVNFTQLMDERRDYYFVYRLAFEDRMFSSDISPVSRVIKVSNSSAEKSIIDEEIKRTILLKGENDLSL